jgi:hypothetical protein
MTLDELQAGERYLIQYKAQTYEMLIVEKAGKAVKMRDLINGKGGWWTASEIHYYTVWKNYHPKNKTHDTSREAKAFE